MGELQIKSMSPNSIERLSMMQKMLPKRAPKSSFRRSSTNPKHSSMGINISNHKVSRPPSSRYRRSLSMSRNR